MSDFPGPTRQHRLFCLVEILGGLFAGLDQVNLPTLAIGLAATGFLYWSRGGLKRYLAKRGVPARRAGLVSRAAPVVAEVARELGILTVAVVTKPFIMEGGKRMKIAEHGIA